MSECTHCRICCQNPPDPGSKWCSECKALRRSLYQGKRVYIPDPPGWKEHLHRLAARASSGQPLFPERSNRA